jgi:hypothetical protein
MKWLLAGASVVLVALLGALVASAAPARGVLVERAYAQSVAATADGLDYLLSELAS